MEVDAKRRRAPESQSELERRVVDLIMHIGEKVRKIWAKL